MRYPDKGCLPTSFRADNPRPRERQKASPTGDAMKDGYTRGARRDPYGAPGDFAAADDLDRYDSISVNDA
ncbi:hypothetical protein [Bauldia litoralis]|uniref:hypothetical protein n=1 Tax=Bauldia litoralis TaxID=665467 RepID=UPI003265C2D0